MGLGVLAMPGRTHPCSISKNNGKRKRKRTHVDVFRLVFIWAAVSVIIVAVSCGIRALATLGGGEEGTLCGDGTWLWLLWEDLELS
jgi:uncharacterized membrane protein